MQSRNTDELHDGFSSLLRVFDMGTSFYFLHAQKQLQPAPTLGTLTAAALLLFSDHSARRGGFKRASDKDRGALSGFEPRAQLHSACG